MNILYVAMEKDDAQWLHAYLASVKRVEARRIRNEIELAIEGDDAEID